ncbi:MAG: CBS domain-containing protein [Rhodospirillaceae bacterium]
MDYCSTAGKSLTVQKFLDKYGHSALKIRSSLTVAEAAASFADTEHGRKYSIAVVVDDNDQVRGVLSLGDIVFGLYRHREKIFKMTVGAIMSANVHTACLADDILCVLQRMAHWDIRHMPVVEDGVLHGLVTRKDALEGLYDEAALELKHMTEFVFRSGARY